MTEGKLKYCYRQQWLALLPHSKKVHGLTPGQGLYVQNLSVLLLHVGSSWLTPTVQRHALAKFMILIASSECAYVSPVIDWRTCLRPMSADGTGMEL